MRRQPSRETMTVFDAAKRYRTEGCPAIVVASRLG